MGVLGDRRPPVRESATAFWAHLDRQCRRRGQSAHGCCVSRGSPGGGGSVGTTYVSLSRQRERECVSKPRSIGIVIKLSAGETHESSHRLPCNGLIGGRLRQPHSCRSGRR